MKDTEPEQAEKVIKAFSNKVKTFTYDGEIHAFSVSIGYTLYKGDGTSLSRLFHQSDTALYAVKLRGRNHYRIYDATMENLNRTSLGFNLETITKNLPLGLLVSEAKPHGKILFVNKTMVEMLECRNIHEFMEFTQGYAPNVVCTCDRERMTKMVWEQSAGPSALHVVQHPHGERARQAGLRHLAHGGQSQLRRGLLRDAHGGQLPAGADV